MSAISNILAYDGAATPVLHTLVPRSVVREKDAITAIWKEALPTLPEIAQVNVTMKLSRDSKGLYTVKQRTSVPVMESISGQNSAGYTAAPKVAFQDTLETTGYFAERGTINGRRLVRQLHINILGGITVSVAPVTTGPLAELFDLLIAPT